MSLLDFLNLNSSRKNPFASEDYYDRQNLDDCDYTPKELSQLQDTRDLGLGPVRIADGVAISRDGYFSAVLQVGTVNFALATADEQEAIIGGYHAVLRQLAGTRYQIKVRMVEADLEPLAARVDYALSNYTSAPLHRLALQYKQFLREELPRRLVLMERRNYVIASVHSPLLVKMGQVYERETGKPSPIFAGLGTQWRGSDNSASRQNKNQAKRNTGSKKNRGRKTAPLNGAEQRREQLLKARADGEMEDKMYEEVERTLRRLKHELSVLVTGLSANGLALRRLNDWELTALYAEYLRPELAQEVRHSLSAQMRTQLRQARQGQATFGSDSNWYGGVVRPLSLPQFIGEQSGTVVVSDLPEESEAYEAGLVHAKTALAKVSPQGEVTPSSNAKPPTLQSPIKNSHPVSTGNTHIQVAAPEDSLLKRKEQVRPTDQSQRDNLNELVKSGSGGNGANRLERRVVAVPVPSFKRTQERPMPKASVEAKE
ncbi:MAG TPA: hypothetical protein VH186_03480 [Chloroflexia bacterium]|nr:hypothetical protein [Chloroflexia bacterium]